MYSYAMNISQCEALLAENPGELIRKLPDLKDTLLTFVAEMLGELPWATCGETLIELACHKSALVREGAILGLRYHIERPEALDIIKLRACDISPGVASAAKDALESM